MFPKRTLLYHRGIDDHVGTYVTDYVYSACCLLLCLQLITRICRQRKKMKKEQEMTSQCSRISNWAPWNWPKTEVTSVTMTTYAIIVFGLSNFIVTLSAGITHQFLQTVEVYNGVNDVWDWLIVWRFGASFSALLCLSLLIMTEQLLAQESILQISRPIRIVYYVTAFILTIAFFVFNYLPLTGTEDPFSIGQSFLVVFAVMFVYGVATTIVTFRGFCCCTGDRDPPPPQPEYTSPVKSINHKHSDNRRYRSEIYTCCKTVVVHCHDNDDADSLRHGDVRSRRWELFFTFIAPWIFISAGAMNHFLKKKCADSDDAFAELGCPLPNAFNHNAAMHVIQILSTICFFVAENMAISRRSKESHFIRVPTSSSMNKDVIENDDVITDVTRRGSDKLLLGSEISNNNKLDRRNDVIYDMASDDNKGIQNSFIASSDNRNQDTIEPLFPSFPVNDVTNENHRTSVYDNLSNHGVKVV